MKQMIKNRFSCLAVLIFGIVGLGITACGPTPSDGLDGGDQRESITHGKAVKASSDLSKVVVAVVAEKTEGQALCTGSILSENLILTAAHCVDGNPTQVRIVFATKVKEASAEQIRVARGVFQNPFWKNPNTEKQGDLAIIQFSGGLPEGFTSVRLVPKTYKVTTGDSVIFVGYGVTDGLERTGSGVLRTTKSTVTGQQSPTEILTDGKETSVCFGDSGGPGFAVIKNNFVQWGVASSVLNQECNEASIHTSVMAYEPWIREIIHEFSTPKKSRKPKKSPTTLFLGPSQE